MSDAPAVDPHADKFRNRLAFALILAFVAMLPLLVWQTIPEANKEIIVYMIGQLSGMATTAIGFYFIQKAGQDALDAKRTENTGKLADAVVAAAAASPAVADASKAAAAGADAVADAAADRADEIAGGER